MLAYSRFLPIQRSPWQNISNRTANFRLGTGNANWRRVRDHALRAQTQEKTSIEKEEQEDSPPDLPLTALTNQASLTILFLAGVAFICSIDRAAMSITILPISQELGFTDVQKGAISSSFFVGYTLTNLVGGALATSLSPRILLATGVLTWSFFTILTPFAARSGSLEVLLAARFFMGIGEGVTYPTIQEIVSRWVPQSSRATSLTRCYSGGQAGVVASLVLAPVLINTLGWDSVFIAFGSLGFIWALAWLPLARDSPLQLLSRSWGLDGSSDARGAAPAELSDTPKDSSSRSNGNGNGSGGNGASSSKGLSQAPVQALAAAEAERPDSGALATTSGRVSSGNGSGSGAAVAELALPGDAFSDSLSRLTGPFGTHLRALNAAQAKPGLNWNEIPWGSFVRERAVWAVFFAHTTWAFTHYVILSWLPTYYAETFGTNVGESAALTVIPWIFTFLITNVAGLTADALVSRGILDLTGTRKVMNTISTAVPASCLLFLASDGAQSIDQTAALGIFTVALAAGGFSGAGFGATHQDIATKYTALLFGITNACSSVSGTVAVYATGEILERTHDWNLVWTLSAGLLLAGNLAYVALGRNEKVLP